MKETVEIEIDFPDIEDLKMTKQSENENVVKMSSFDWNPERSRAALLFAEGLSQQAVADELKKSLRTIQRWVYDIEFSAEVDRLSVMTGIASKAERLRIAKRVIKQKTDNAIIPTEKDLLDWLKFAQSETDGIKLDIAKLLAAVPENAASAAD